METLPATIETQEQDTSLPFTVLNHEIQGKLDAVVEKWGTYTPVKVEDAAQRELEYLDFSARKKLIKKIEAQQKLYAQPVKDLLERVNNAFKKATLAIAGSCVASEKVIGEYDSELRRKIEEARRAQQAILDAEAAKEKARLAAIAEEEKLFGDAQKAEVLEKKIEEVKPIIAALPEVDLSGGRLTWHFEITDPDKVPDLWRIPSRPDEVKIGQMVRNAQSGCKENEIKLNIPGVRVYSQTKLAGAR